MDNLVKLRWYKYLIIWFYLVSYRININPWNSQVPSQLMQVPPCSMKDDLIFFFKWKTTSIFLLMEDSLNILMYGRRPQKSNATLNKYKIKQFSSQCNKTINGCVTTQGNLVYTIVHVETDWQSSLFCTNISVDFLFYVSSVLLCPTW